MAGSPVWDACFFVYYFMDEEKVMNEKEKVNQITEGVIWKQLLLFFFPIAGHPSWPGSPRRSCSHLHETIPSSLLLS